MEKLTIKSGGKILLETTDPEKIAAVKENLKALEEKKQDLQKRFRARMQLYKDVANKIDSGEQDIHINISKSIGKPLVLKELPDRITKNQDTV